LVGSTYGRFCIKFPKSKMKGERHRLSHKNWLIDWCLTSSEQFFSYIQDDIKIGIPKMITNSQYLHQQQSEVSTHEIKNSTNSCHLIHFVYASTGYRNGSINLCIHENTIFTQTMKISIHEFKYIHSIYVSM
jgi:hypothetical protein